MKSDLNDFISLVRTNGLLTSTHFYVFIPNIGENLESKNMMMMCDSTVIPGMNLMTADTRIFGEATEMPHSIIYAPLVLSFYVDRDLIAKRALDRWMNSVFDRDTRTVGFYDDYTRDVDVFLTDKTGETVYCIRLHEAYPKNIGDIHLSYAGDSVLKVDVTLAYKWSSVQNVSASGETIVMTESNRRATDPFINRDFTQTIGNFGKTNGSVASSFPETMGNFTGEFSRGYAIPTAIDVIPPVSSAILKPPSLRETIEQAGELTRTGFGRASNVMEAAFGSSDMASSLANQMIVGSRAISRSMGNYSGGLLDLGSSLNNLARPISNLTSSMFSLGDSLSIVNDALQAHGMGSPFAKSINTINRHASELAFVSTLSGIPGQLSGFGSALSSTGAIFNETVYSMRSLEGFNPQIESAVRNMGTTFIDGGTRTHNLSADISSRLETGEL